LMSCSAPSKPPMENRTGNGYGRTKSSLRGSVSGSSVARLLESFPTCAPTEEIDDRLLRDMQELISGGSTETLQWIKMEPPTST
jgi:hypothetical protein